MLKRYIRRMQIAVCVFVLLCEACLLQQFTQEDKNTVSIVELINQRQANSIINIIIIIILILLSRRQRQCMSFSVHFSVLFRMTFTSQHFGFIVIFL